MTVNTGVKGTLAKLLATEDLVIEHRSVSTASFDVGKRVLTLPNWEKASESVYDLLVSHEVGHALFTPADGWQTMECPQSFVNVTEDARVEKLMKRKYPGLPKTFYRGYQQLQDDDFFSLDGTTEKMNLVDRINIFFKVGNFIDVKFTEEEQKFVDDTAAAETFQDAIAVANAIWEYMKLQRKQEKVSEMTPPPVGQEGATSPMGNAEGEEGEEEDGDSENRTTADEQTEEKQDAGSQGGSADELDATTDAAFEQAMEELTKQVYSESIYFELPKFTVEQVVVPCADILKENRIHFSGLEENGAEQVQLAETAWKKFRKNSQQEVNYLVKEFECRKAASTYARSSSAKTGVLDTSKLHTYKYKDDLFKRVSVIPEGKNHGMIFLVDWSGSMSNNIIDTVNQVIQLCWFCQKSNIPFDVYAFTNDTYMIYKRLERNGITDTHNEGRVIKEVPNQFALDNYFAMMHLASSKQKNRDLEDSLKYLFFNAGAIGYKGGWQHEFFFFPTPGLGLSGTPLNEALVCLHVLIPQMKRQAEKVTVCILTDGEAAGSGVWSDKWRYDGRPWANHIRQNCQLRDRKLGKIYEKIADNNVGLSEVLLMNLRDRFPTVNFLGFRLLAPRESGSFFRQLFNWTYDEAYDRFITTYKKEKYAVCSLRGYHQLYVMPTSNQEDVSGLDDVSEEASKAEITRAFKKMFKSKKNNKKMLNAFVQTVA